MSDDESWLTLGPADDVAGDSVVCGVFGATWKHYGCVSPTVIGSRVANRCHRPCWYPFHVGEIVVVGCRCEVTDRSCVYLDADEATSLGGDLSLSLILWSVESICGSLGALYACCAWTYIWSLTAPLVWADDVSVVRSCGSFRFAAAATYVNYVNEPDVEADVVSVCSCEVGVMSSN